MVTKGKGKMEIKISRSDKNVYEKFDMDNWMCLPPYTPEDSTSFFDVGNLVYCQSESSQYEGDIDIKEIYSQILKNKKSKNL